MKRKKHKFHRKIRSRDSQKTRFQDREPNRPSLDPQQKKKKKKNAKQNKTKTGQAQLRTYLPTFRKNKNNAVDDYNQTAAKTT